MERLVKSINTLDNKLNDLNANTGSLGENKQEKINKVKSKTKLSFP